MVESLTESLEMVLPALAVMCAAGFVLMVLMGIIVMCYGIWSEIGERRDKRHVQKMEREKIAREIWTKRAELGRPAKHIHHVHVGGTTVP